MTEKTETKEKLTIGKRIIVFIGPEGSGKTKIAERLSKETGKPYVSTGSIIRHLQLCDFGPLGDECRKMRDEKTYLSGESIIKLLIHRLSQDDTSEGLILDGGLRTLEETVAFQSMLEEAGRALPLTILYIQIPEWMSYERLIWGEEARKREDDTVEAVASRLAKFHFKLEERISFIERQEGWNLIPIDGTGGKEEVFKLVTKALE